ncbi:uncharacterized protein LOC6537343 [Drosophila yakuba]|uniref:DUF4788 domain-containing protein n=1 Tax=Drosophila yakuba TaxID=7245 RepID=B4PTB3_DROYA|nr:uncharacterized protein LOC6537343 [Drosophila yakuba]EDW97612.1 uncharacterized protein Dyak_GE24222 [Drosophila yakuba]
MGKKGKKDKGKKGKKSVFGSRSAPGPIEPPEPVLPKNTPVFSFDLVITRLEVKGVVLADARKLLVKVGFGGNNLRLTASRTNVSEFKPNASHTFQAEPPNLAQKVDENGIDFEVVYDGQVVGLGKLSLPKRLSNRIKLDMKAFSYTSTCPLEMEGKPVGALEFLCKLLIRCGDYAREGETCPNLDRNLSPKDIVFVVGKSQANTSCCDPCRDALEIEARKQKDYSIQSRFSQK